MALIIIKGNNLSDLLRGSMLLRSWEIIIFSGGKNANMLKMSLKDISICLIKLYYNQKPLANSTLQHLKFRNLIKYNKIKRFNYKMHQFISNKGILKLKITTYNLKI